MSQVKMGFKIFIAVVLAVAATFLRSKDQLLFWIVYGVFILYTLGLAIWYNRKKMKIFLHSRRENTGMEEKKILKTNSALCRRFGGIAAVFLVLFAYFNLNNIGKAAKAAGNVIQSIGRFVIYYIMNLYYLVNELFTKLFSFMQFHEEEEEYIPPDLFLEDNVEKGGIVQEIIAGIGALIILIFISIFIYMEIKDLIYNIKHREKKAAEIMAKDSPRAVGTVKIKLSEKEHTSHENKEIRKIYKKGMLRMMGDKGVDLASTPLEQRRSAHLQGFFVTEELTDVYEKARYTKNSSGKDEIKRMKVLMEEADLSNKKNATNDKNK